MWWANLQLGLRSWDAHAPLAPQSSSALSLSTRGGTAARAEVVCGCAINGYHERSMAGRPMNMHFSMQVYVLRPARYIRTVWPLQHKQSTRRGGAGRFAARPPGDGASLHCETMLEHALSIKGAGRPMWIPEEMLGVHKRSPHFPVLVRSKVAVSGQPVAAVSVLDSPVAAAIVVSSALVAGLCGAWLSLRALST
jgi:hypothetical protein